MVDPDVSVVLPDLESSMNSNLEILPEMNNFYSAATVTKRTINRLDSHMEISQAVALDIPTEKEHVRAPKVIELNISG